MTGQRRVHHVDLDLAEEGKETHAKAQRRKGGRNKTVVRTGTCMTGSSITLEIALHASSKHSVSRLLFTCGVNRDVINQHPAGGAEDPHR